MKIEHLIQNEILLALGSRPDVRIWRQNSGVFLSADATRHIRGAPAGTADLGGVLRIDTPSGPLGVALQVEVKSATGRQTREQRAFQRMIESMGGVYIVARSGPDAVRQVEFWAAKLGRREQ